METCSAVGLGSKPCMHARVEINSAYALLFWILGPDEHPLHKLKLARQRYVLFRQACMTLARPRKARPAFAHQTSRAAPLVDVCDSSW